MVVENVFSDLRLNWLETKKGKAISKINERREEEKYSAAQKRARKNPGKMVKKVLVQLIKTLGLRGIRLVDSLNSNHCTVYTSQGEIISWELRRRPINIGPSLIVHVGVVGNKGIPICFNVGLVNDKNFTKSKSLSQDDLIEAIKDQKSHIMEAITRECLYN